MNFSVLTSHFLVTAPNNGYSSASLLISLPTYSRSQSQSYVTTDGGSASLFWCQAPSGAQDQVLVTVSCQLQVCLGGTPSLTRGWVCLLQLLLAFANAVILGPQSRGTHDHILLSQILDSPNLDGQVPVFTGTELPSYALRHWVG
jgi:hypothetical protein